MFKRAEAMVAYKGRRAFSMQRNKVESSVAPARGRKVPAAMARYFPASSRVAVSFVYSPIIRSGKSTQKNINKPAMTAPKIRFV